ncbi:DUF1796 family putative cysteine peptidase [Pararobbsia silviterrae]|uniref:Uncharacterized protein n=1 Tax=Pararobbsia silviterrae TaxID=1792498 RepID=A0A494XDJ6_9BURK|nr:DUF1796 family putative cysteine peptidase [Pararobbsia silviterrae]RKP47741.1 hypothetical protein D7S86_22515 [Pararobbsia silviterrae]
MLNRMFSRGVSQVVADAPVAEVASSEHERLARAGLRAAYLGILGREPDAPGFKDNLRQFADASFEDGMTRIVNGFVQSPEALPILMSHVVHHMRPEAARHRVSKGPTYHHAVSLGFNCMPSRVFKQYGLKRYSLPFDWIFSGPRAVDHMIRDDFGEMMSPRHYVPIPVEARGSSNLGICDHRFYLDAFGVKDMFNHHDPSKAEDRGYLGRCVYRFKKLYELDEPKLYVATVEDDAYVPHEASSLNDAIHARSRKAKLLFVRLGNAPEGSLAPIVTSEQHGEDFEVVRFLGVGRVDDVVFPNMLDEIAFMWMLLRHDIVPSNTIPGGAR